MPQPPANKTPVKAQPPSSPHRERIVILIALVVILAIAVFVVYRPKEKKFFEYAPKGELAPGFPKELVLPNLTLDSSYSASYAKDLNQFTSALNSQDSLDKIFQAYKTYLGANNWKITNVTAYPGSRGIYARKDQADINVAIIDQGDKRAVSVTYVKKGVAENK